MHAFIITGASRGLGRALSETLLADGHFVAAIARHTSSALAPLLQRYPEQLMTMDADLSQATDISHCIEHVLEQLPLTECSSLTLINNAGVVTPIAQAGHYSDKELIQAITLNLTAPMLTTDALLKASAHHTLDVRILNISSGAAAHPYPGWGVYCATKAGLDHFSRSIALEQQQHLKPAQIVALYPGVIDTDMQTAIRASDTQQFPSKERFDTLKAEGGLNSPEKAARQIIDYLLSPAFGQVAVVDIRQLS
ncbi:SDR family oxidoreductase [Neisseriaceae bacterium TC5R-5]|nr:SDR family oxidoreductase [Neisseriaceae bacterium TC5R-5]